jgi:hypothetical protein
LSRKIDKLKLDLDKISTDRNKYNEWMHQNQYEERNIGYFNCIPPEIFHKIVGYLPKSRLPETCKSMRIIIEMKFSTYTKSVCGNAVKYFEDKFGNDYYMWYSILKCKKGIYILRDGYIIRKFNVPNSYRYKVYNYTNKYWYYSASEFYANSNGYIISDNGVSEVIVYGNNNIIKFDSCHMIPLGEGICIYMPKNEYDQKLYINMINKGKIFKECKDMIMDKFISYIHEYISHDNPFDI